MGEHEHGGVMINREMQWALNSPFTELSLCHGHVYKSEAIRSAPAGILPCRSSWRGRLKFKNATDGSYIDGED